MTELTMTSELRLARSVKISVEAGVAIVRPPLPELLRPALSYKELRFRRTEGGRVQHAWVTMQVCAAHEDGLMIPTGCIPRVVQHLAQAGYDVQVEDPRNRNDPPYRFSELHVNDTEATFPGLAATLASHVEGILEVTGDTRKANLLGVMCQLFHRAKIFVACKTIQATQTISTQLQHFLGGEVEAVHGHTWQSACRVVCGTFGSLNRSDAADWHILIFADAFDGIQKVNHEARAAYLDRRVYAIIDSCRQRTRRDELAFEALVGPLIYRAPRCRRRQVTEFSSAFATYESSRLQLPEDARERRVRLRRDDQRNQAIADVALALSRGDDGPLWEHGLFLVEGESLSGLGVGSGVNILVDSIDHGERLHGLLPDWHFVHARPNHDPATANGATPTHWGIPGNSIVTAVSASTQYLIGRILVWASGGCLPYIPPAVVHSPSPQLLVDFMDDGNHLIAADTRMRLEAYREMGCRILGENPALTERALILASESTHPKRTKNTSRRPRRPLHRSVRNP